MRDKSIAVLAYTLFLLTTGTLFLRPAELLEFLADWPIYETLILSTLLLTINSLQGHFFWYYLQRQPISLCVVGLFICVLISHLQHIYVSGALDSGTLFVKSMIYYGLLLTTVNSPARLRGLLLTVAIVGSTMVTLCVLDYFEIFDFVFIQHLDDLDGITEDNEIITVLRMRGTGIFQDPNDLASAIILTGVLCSYFLMDKSLAVFRYLWLIPMGILFIGLLCTQSRGGLLACCVAGMAFVILHFGGKMAIVASVLGVCLLPLVAGRQTTVDMEEGTGQERIQLWREGFDALKSSDLVFGIGHGAYPDVAGLVAHNSYIHAYVELGLVGGTFFFGCFLFAGIQFYRMSYLTDEIDNPELLRMKPFIISMLAGWGMSLFSLSRCYVVPTYLVFGICAAYLNLVWLHSAAGEPLIIWNRRYLFRLVASSACAFTGLYIMTAIMAR